MMISTLTEFQVFYDNGRKIWSANAAQIGPGETVSGPAAIVEDETTIILPSSRRAICQPDGCIDLTVKVEG